MRKIRVLLSLSVIVLFAFLMMHYIPSEAGDLKKKFRKEVVDTHLLTNEEFFTKMTKANVIVIDVRSPGELASGKIEGAINLNLYDYAFEENVKSYDKSKEILLYCSSGSRSSDALEIFEKNGFTQVYELENGIRDWKQEGYPIIEVK